MLRVAQVRKDLEVTKEDVDRVLTPETRYLVEGPGGQNLRISIGSNYAFECVCCRDIGLSYATYALVKKKMGAGVITETDANSIKGRIDRKISRLEDLDAAPEFNSLLHVTKDGFVCDHCYDTIYDENGGLPNAVSFK
jgi:hypothetical protein